MIDLKKLYNEHPECFEDSAKFRAYLIDLYPEEKKARINVLTAMLADGAAEIAKSDDSFTNNSFCRKICGEYGFSENIVSECFNLFVAIFSLPPKEAGRNGGTEKIKKKRISRNTLICPECGKKVDAKNHCCKSCGYPMGLILNGTEGLQIQINRFGFNDEDEAEVCGYSGSETEIVIPVKYQGVIVNSIWKRAFMGNAKVRKVVMQNSITQIWGHAFSNCSTLTEVRLSECLHLIVQGAFENCSALKKIIIPESVDEMQKDIFKGCKNLTIYCRAEQQPSRWWENWNPDNLPVVWGYQGK